LYHVPACLYFMTLTHINSVRRLSGELLSNGIATSNQADIGGALQVYIYISLIQLCTGHIIQIISIRSSHSRSCRAFYFKEYHMQ
jgi:hypothetical protein